MIDHVGIEVPASKYTETIAWYEAVLFPLGYRKAFTLANGELVGFRDNRNGDNVDWWVSSRGVDSGVDEVNVTTHVAFCAKDRATVDNFHRIGIAAGGKNSGDPGVRSAYHANYYGAFVLDPAGNKIEAVCHAGAAARRGFVSASDVESSE
ncbi:Glyoxalase/bleomycin resistance protein/dioxygenase-like protein [Apodospora peruviana]|uniref:Glyoxalase/bleomycin resistance protein/dioxygenase-like protein n=1 Tax=Apodospora peruviana TaxID=516989 RepID=A0AAE0HX35_9PEZI|nr:Glyoxalase/bleomycin resistance protein/dioxygenase-like protein [Apodospora peruviana]